MKVADFKKAKPVVDRLEAFEDVIKGLKGRSVGKVSFIFDDQHTGRRSMTVTGEAAQILVANMDEILKAELASAEKALAKIGDK
jgi:hypothetical protein